MSTTLKFTPYEMPAADLGQPNPLPDMKETLDFHVNLVFDKSIPEEEHDSFRQGHVKTALPYLIQDGYDRNKKPRAFNAAILENDYLKAVFLPELGGRLWSLKDKINDKELLHLNPVFQPANLAIRNAWISGGVEWNIGIRGHTPFTVSPLFTAEYAMPDGTPVLRMYEWERVRRAAYQIETFLPEDSKFLFVRIQIVNTQNEETPMYWWSNTAVNETPDVRVIAPADLAYGHDYNRAMAKIPVPVSEGIDKSYTTRVPRAMDWFFDIPKDRRKWECAVNGEGYGLIQASTDRLISRKLFMWGNSPGGRRWQEFLSVPGSAYIEIQAGLIHTQMQYATMPPGAKWDWLEAYGAIETDPVKAHGEWRGAYSHVTEKLNDVLPVGVLNDYLNKIGDASQTAAARLIYNGSGWAALETARARNTGETFDAGGLEFPSASMDGEQSFWRQLLNGGGIIEPDVSEEPASYMIQPEWLALLKNFIDSGKCDNWYGWLQLGVLYFANEKYQEAEEAFNVSVKHRPNAWALRNLAALLNLRGETKNAANKLLEAAELLQHKHIVVECGKALIKAGMYDEFKSFEQNLPDSLRGHGRIKVQKIEALIHLGELDAAEIIFGQDLTVNDVREGELLLSDLWVLLHKKMMAQETGAGLDSISDDDALAQYPLPEHIDFRMSAKQK